MIQWSSELVANSGEVAAEGVEDDAVVSGVDDVIQLTE
jgi:hypothetical protein